MSGSRTFTRTNRPGLIAVSTAGFTAVSNTATDTQIAALTIPANTISDGDIVVFETGGTLTNTSGGAINHTFRLKIGATTALTSTAISISSNAADREWYLRAVIINPSATTQKITALLAYALPDAANWGGGSATPVGYGTAAEATNVPVNVTLTVQPASASTAQSIQATWAAMYRPF